MLLRWLVACADVKSEMIRAVLKKAGVVNVTPFQQPVNEKLDRACVLARAGHVDEAWKSIQKPDLSRETPRRWEAVYLTELLAQKRGDATIARRHWNAVALGNPQGPWGSKSVVQLSEAPNSTGKLGIVSGFRVRSSHPVNRERGRIRLRAPAELGKVIEQAVDSLLIDQDPDGGWHDPFMEIHPAAGPGSRYDKAVARTGLIVDMLIQVRTHLAKPGRVDRAIDRGVKFVGRFADEPAPHVWKLTYALHLQVAILNSDIGLNKKVARERVKSLLTSLEGMQHDGGWSYMPPPRIYSFNTALVLLLLIDLRAAGYSIPKKVTVAAAKFLESLRREAEKREFHYATNVRHRSVRESSCRSPLCELALGRIAHKKKVKQVRAAVKLFFANEVAVRETTKIFESYFSPTSLNDAYRYYFGHYYTARALSALPHEEARAFAHQQTAILLAQLELDGSFVDAQMQGKSYSTAMAILTLLEDLKQMDR